MALLDACSRRRPCPRPRALPRRGARCLGLQGRRYLHYPRISHTSPAAAMGAGWLARGTGELPFCKTDSAPSAQGEMSRGSPAPPGGRPGPPPPPLGPRYFVGTSRTTEVHKKRAALLQPAREGPKGARALLGWCGLPKIFFPRDPTSTPPWVVGGPSGGAGGGQVRPGPAAPRPAGPALAPLATLGSLSQPSGWATRS